MDKPVSGYLLITDISGYSMYLNESELEHAQGTLTDLLNLLVEHTRPPLIISRLEGDAVISYALREDFLDGQTVVEMIENTYVAFRRAIELMVLNNTCQCNACANVSTLDLKFLFHFGEFAVQRLADHHELVGSDVNLIFRLVKNQVQEQTGIRAYTLYTDAAIQQLGLAEIGATMTPHVEHDEIAGEVKVWVQDMHPVWQEKRAATLVELPPDDVVFEHSIKIDAPQELVWDRYARPEYRSIIFGSDRVEVSNRSGGRIAPGSVYVCYHGDQIINYTVLEYQPFERMVVRQTGIFMNTSGLGEHLFEPTESGTRATLRIAKAEGPLLGRVIMGLMRPMFFREVTRRIEELKQAIERDLAATRAAGMAGFEFSSDAVRQAAAASLEGAEEREPR